MPNPDFKARYRQVTTPDGRKILEHRYVMEQVLGRRLYPWEQVHHKNHDRLDNRPGNLEVVSSREHGERHTIHQVTKPCVICGSLFTPHKTKRVRQQTCSTACKSELLSRRNTNRADTKPCTECNVEFFGLPQSLTCSDACRTARNKRLQRERRGAA